MASIVVRLKWPINVRKVSISCRVAVAGMTTMVGDGVAKCRAGLTSPAELLRVTTAR